MEHVGIVSGPGRTVSVTTHDPKESDFSRVVENDWGFRAANARTTTFWRKAKP